MFAVEEQGDAPGCIRAAGSEGLLRWVKNPLSGRPLICLRWGELCFPPPLNLSLLKGSSSPEESAPSRKGLKAANIACSPRPVHGCSSQSDTNRALGSFAAFLRIPQPAKKSSSAGCFTPSAAALAELAESSGCCCVLTARWKVFPSPMSWVWPGQG